MTKASGRAAPGSKKASGSNKARATGWGTRWLTTLENSAAIPDEALERGRAYALHDWQLEVDLEPGRAEATARQGPRIRNTAVVEVPVLSAREWDVVVGLIAESSARTAALLDHELDLGLLGEAKAKGVGLLPQPKRLRTSCSCRNWGELCKHSSAVLYLLADVFDEAPFDLLTWRGLSYAELVERVHHARNVNSGDNGSTNTSNNETSSIDDDSTYTKTVDSESSSHTPQSPKPTLTMNAIDAWNRTTAELPSALPLPPSPATVPPYPSDAPPNAPFTGDGLHSLVSDAVLRAHQLGDQGKVSCLSLPVEADLGRRAALAEETGQWARLVAHSGRPSRELSMRANAWRIAGAAGIEITLTSRETREESTTVQFRKNDDEQWFRFEKISGRWTLVSGPGSDPTELGAVDL